MKNITLDKAKELWGDDVIEVDKNYLVKRFGKYESNITYVLDKQGWTDENGELINPIVPFEDQELWYSTNLVFHGKPAFLFGDFWRSRKGGACFRPKEPAKAQHLLVKVAWGGPFESSRGLYKDEAEVQAGKNLVYFRHAASGGRGIGNDYWVIPVGFFAPRYDPEFDGPEKTTISDFSQNEKWIRETYQKRILESRKNIAKTYRDKLAALEKSRKARKQYESRLLAAQESLLQLEGHRVMIPRLLLYDDKFSYDSEEYHYDEESVKIVERHVLAMKFHVQYKMDEEKREKEARNFWEPLFKKWLDKKGRTDAYVRTNNDYFIVCPFVREEHIPYSGNGMNRLISLF